MIFRLIIAILLLPSTVDAQTDAFLINLLRSNENTWFQEKIDKAAEYRIQVIYTQVDRDRQGRPTLKHHTFRLDENEYFNPASTVKLPLALLSLEKLNSLKIRGVDRNTTIFFDSAYSGQRRAHRDETSADGFPSIAHYIRKALLVSDNDAYNRMYEFVGQRDINRSLQRKGYNSARITHRFIALTEQENRCTNPVRFVGADGETLYHQAPTCNEDSFDFSRVERVGIGHFRRGELVNEPMDFSRKNRLSLIDLHTILLAVMLPDAVSPAQRFELADEDYRFMHQYMSQFPRETNYPKYDSSEYFDSYVKFFFRDSLHRSLPEGVRVFNKVGWSYGFMTDVSYVVDFRNGVEFALSAVIYANSDGILNDDQYEYAAIAHPFLYQLGQTIYRYELGRTRKYPARLKEFKVRYETRIDDGRPTIQDVDN